MKKTISRGKCELFNSGETGGNSETPRYCYQLFGDPSTRTARQWKEFLFEAGREMEEARKNKDKERYILASYKILYAWLCRNHLRKKPWDKFRQQNWWQKLELPKV